MNVMNVKTNGWGDPTSPDFRTRKVPVVDWKGIPIGEMVVREHDLTNPIDAAVTQDRPLITAPVSRNTIRRCDPREKGLPVTLTQLAHGMFDRAGFAGGGPEGDGTDLYGDTWSRGGVHRQGPDADRVGKFMASQRPHPRRRPGKPVAQRPRLGISCPSDCEVVELRLTGTVIRRRAVPIAITAHAESKANGHNGQSVAVRPQQPTVDRPVAYHGPNADARVAC